MIMTSSSLRTSRMIRSRDVTSPVFGLSWKRPLYVDMSDDLRGERDDLHEVAGAELASHRAEDTRATRIPVVVDEDDRVPVEADVAAVRAAELALLPHDDALDD